MLVAKAIRKTVAQRIHAIGRVEAYSTVEIKSQISGQVMQVHFKEGQEVRKAICCSPSIRAHSMPL